MAQKLITNPIAEVLKRNHAVNLKHRQTTGETEDFEPALKLFTPWTNCTWLISEWDGADEMFGLCDLGKGLPELGYVSLEEVVRAVGPGGLKIERDKWFEPTMKLSAYAEEAKEKGYISA